MLGLPTHRLASLPQPQPQLTYLGAIYSKLPQSVEWNLTFGEMHKQFMPHDTQEHDGSQREMDVDKQNSTENTDTAMKTTDMWSKEIASERNSTTPSIQPQQSKTPSSEVSSTHIMQTGSISPHEQSPSRATPSSIISCSKTVEAIGSTSSASPHITSSTSPLATFRSRVIETEQDCSTSTKHQKVSQEIEDTERSYLATLKFLREQAEIFPPKLAKRIFSNLQDIWSVNNELYRRILRGKWHIGDIFLQVAPFLKVYALYLNNFPNSLTTLQLHPHLSSPELCAALLTPVQRLPRYVMLLRSLRSLTPVNHPEYGSISKAFDLISSITEHVNTAIATSEAADHLLKNGIRLEPGRKLLRQDTMRKVSRKGVQLRRLALCNDTLIYDGDRYFRLDTVTVLDPAKSMDISCKLRNGVVPIGDAMTMFQILTPNKSFALQSERKYQWIASIQEAKSAYMDTLNAHSLAVEELAPVWIPDQSVGSCMRCSDMFRMWKRRHHCRRCGNVVCSRCSDNVKLLKH